jgi:pyruvate dehydrogenase phosphatase
MATYGETDLGWGDYGPWAYRKVAEPELTSLLTREADPKTIAGVDCITFQPAPGGAQLNQDRYAVEDWELGDGVWKFVAVFDGM